jgi:hypothetical protein
MRRIAIFILTVFALVMNLTLFSQTNNYIEYYRNIEKGINTGVFEKNNDSTIYYFNKAFEYAEPFAEDLLILSKAFYKNGKKDEGFKFLIESVKNGIDTSSISKIEIWTALNQKESNEVIKTFNSYVFNIDTTLYLELDSVINLEQSAREFVMKHRSDSLFELAEKEMHFQDSSNREWILSTIERKGWMGRKLIGNDRKSFTLLLHIKKPWIDENFAVLKSEIEQGNLNPSYLAASIDRYLARKSGLKYGSFLPGTFRGNTDTEQMQENRYKIGALSTKVFNYRTKFRIREMTIKTA